jgi:hypothetical protein
MGAAMQPEAPLKRAIAFFDGHNLFHAARESFGYSYPSYDVQALGRKLRERMGWSLTQVRFYTGIPDSSDDAFWNHFWVNKLRDMRWQKVHVFSRSLRYRNRRIKLPDGTEHTFLSGEEKGIDARLALDTIPTTPAWTAATTARKRPVTERQSRRAICASWSFGLSQLHVTVCHSKLYRILGPGRWFRPRTVWKRILKMPAR